MKRGFTLIELLVAMGTAAVALAPFLLLVSSSYDSYQALYVQSSVQVDSEGAAERIFRRATHGRVSVHPDNHGLSFADGSSVEWLGGRLRLKQGSRSVDLLPYAVTDFTVARHGASLTLNFDVQAPGGHHGALRCYHQIFDGGKP